MTQTMVRLAPKELALWLGLPLEAVQQKVRAKTEEGTWRIVADAASPEGERVELPAADLNAELDARHGDVPVIEDADPGVAKLEAELARARHRNDELNRLLLQATHAIEEAQAHSRTQAQPQAQPPKVEEKESAASRDSELIDDLIEAKRALVAAYDKILDLQKQVYGANEHVAAAREDSAAVETIYSILDRLKGQRSES